ncbi:MAG: SRPBCC domain-containing protein [Prolixibacteraceae bacterium]|nr:SRPBCC domain-containing protein [Prolixibacteraceae bacterium]MBN2648174.1 SRPBCC domain-containing protein [Prolixibacteraceae bacterium]
MGKQKLEMEYVVNCSPKVLYNRLSTASGLSEWFADNVSVNGKKYTFTWDGAEQDAELALKKENLIVRFNWLDDDSYFEFRITRDELTGDVSLLITDFADDDELDEIRSLWDSQITTLKHLMGS